MRGYRKSGIHDPWSLDYAITSQIWLRGLQLINEPLRETRAGYSIMTMSSNRNFQPKRDGSLDNSPTWCLSQTGNRDHNSKHPKHPGSKYFVRRSTKKIFISRFVLSSRSLERAYQSAISIEIFENRFMIAGIESTGKYSEEIFGYVGDR